jgi:hypothetical protein
MMDQSVAIGTHPGGIFMHILHFWEYTQIVNKHEILYNIERINSIEGNESTCDKF